MAQGGLKADQIRIAGTGRIYVGDADTIAAPTTEVSALSSAWTDVGYTFEDGVTFSLDRTINNVMSWQSKRPTRRFAAEQIERIATELQQWNEVTLPLAFGGGVVTEPTPGHYVYDFPDADDALPEKAMIVDWEDDGFHYRLFVPRGTVTDTVEVNLTRTEESRLPITFESLEKPKLFTDDPAFELGEGS